jgi:DNA-binding response OmpR family regulator
MTDELRVLVVDDVHDAAETMAMALTLEGFQARTAFDGLQALEVAEAFSPHVVLFDVGMPRMDGCDLSRTLRERYGDDMILIAVTGRDVGDHRVVGAMRLADHYFMKPVDLDALRRVLSTPTARAHPDPNRRNS